MKAFLMYRDRDFDVDADPPPGATALTQDLGLDTLFGAMAAGDRFLFGVARSAVLASLDAPDAIRYRQQLLADCVAQPWRTFTSVESTPAAPESTGISFAECAFDRILEARVALAAVGVAPGEGLRFQLSLWQGGLPMGAIPQQDWIEMPTTNPNEMGD